LYDIQTRPLSSSQINAFWGQVNCNTLLTLHKRATHFGIAEKYQFCMPQFDAYPGRCLGMFYMIEYLHAFFMQDPLEPHAGLFDIMGAWYRNNPFCCQYGYSKADYR